MEELYKEWVKTRETLMCHIRELDRETPTSVGQEHPAWVNQMLEVYRVCEAEASPIPRYRTLTEWANAFGIRFTRLGTDPVLPWICFKSGLPQQQEIGSTALQAAEKFATKYGITPPVLF